MQLIREKNLGIEIGSNDAKVILINEDSPKIDRLAEYDVIISHQRLIENKFIVYSPGEYELKSVLINTNSSDVSSNEIHFAEIIIEGITLFYCFSNFKFNDESYKEIEDVDILLIDSKTNKIDLQKLITRFDPEVFVVVGDTDESNKVLAEAGISNVNTEKKLKFKSDDFGSEDYVFQTVILD
ncbi:hypothetical protein KBD45_00110 [Candidatus Dojkabacteria bacterium]|nr:hypothetical protein [Candidatus Dojkabacteria bacterium]